MRIGVLALQGAFREHISVLERLGAETVEVRLPEQLDGLDGLIIPGGESTTMMRLMGLYGLDEAIRAFSGPIFGTCAGMIVLDRERLGLIAEQVESVLPSAVDHNADGEVLGIDYAQVTVALLDHVQQLTKRIEMLEALL